MADARAAPGDPTGLDSTALNEPQRSPATIRFGPPTRCDHVLSAAMRATQRATAASSPPAEPPFGIGHNESPARTLSGSTRGCGAGPDRPDGRHTAVWPPRWEPRPERRRVSRAAFFSGAALAGRCPTPRTAPAATAAVRGPPRLPVPAARSSRCRPRRRCRQQRLAALVEERRRSRPPGEHGKQSGTRQPEVEAARAGGGGLAADPLLGRGGPLGDRSPPRGR